MVDTTDTTKFMNVPPNSQFYCLIGKKAGLNLHTFFHMGFIDENNQAQILLEIGKISDKGLRYKDHGLNVLSNALFSETGAVIRNENHMLRKNCFTDVEHSINYSAYSITQVQYLYFLGLLKQIDTEQQQLFKRNVEEIIFSEIEQGVLSNKLNTIAKRRQQLFNALCKGMLIKAYQPVDTDNNYQYQELYKWQTKFKNQSQLDNKLRHSAQNLSLNNNCRHSGLDFLNYLFESSFKDLHKNVSSCFLRGMPCFVTMQAGHYTSQLYLLPLPPSSYQLDNEQHKILSTLYKRMESLLLRNYNHPNTQHKFDLLNKIYGSLVTNKTVEINFLRSIVLHSHSQSSKTIIDQHRGLYLPFFQSTKTSIMFNDFEKQFAYEKQNINID